MFCNKCGNEINENNNFCPVCGNNITQTNSKETNLSKNNNKYQESIYNKNEGSIGQGVLFAFLGSIGFILCVALWRKKTWKGFGITWLAFIVILIIAIGIYYILKHLNLI